MGGFAAAVGRELRVTLREGADLVLAIAFFVLVGVLFAFGAGPQPRTLAAIAPGVIWVAALLAAMLSVDRLFAADHRDGTLDLLALDPLPLWALSLAKALAHWLTTGWPLILCAPVLALMLGLPADGIAALVAALVLGTAQLSLLGGLGAALTLGARRGSVLVSLLVLPLAIPVLIFGAAGAEAALLGLPVWPHLKLLSGLLLGALVVVPPCTAAALRQAIADS